MTRVWIDQLPRPGAEQMALDHTLRDFAEAEGIAVLRLYQWDQSTISFGANEAALRHWERELIERDRVPVVRRPSGGRAVWHDRSDLTYAWTGPLAEFNGQQTSYLAIHQRMMTALNRAGLAATLAPPPLRLPGLRRGACFDVAVGGEVLVGDVKVIGSAQVVTRSALLQHGAIARSDHATMLAGYGRPTESSPARPKGAPPILPEAGLIAEAIAAEWFAHGARPIEPELTARANSASVQHVARYRDPLWTWRR